MKKCLSIRNNIKSMRIMIYQNDITKSPISIRVETTGLSNTRYYIHHFIYSFQILGS